MPKRALRCLVEIDARSVTSPGTWLPKREDVFLSINLFGQVRKTRLVASTFPLVFNDRLKFDKVFHTASEPSQIAESLGGLTTRIELIQSSNMFSDGHLLAYHECPARNFLYPYTNYSQTYGVQDREILLERTLAFPGISPRLEFSSKVTIEETHASLAQDTGYSTIVDDSSWDRNREVTGYSERRSRSRTRSPLPSGRHPSYTRSTVASAGRRRSLSPVAPLHAEMRNLHFYDRYRSPSPSSRRYGSSSLYRRSTMSSAGRCRSASPVAAFNGDRRGNVHFYDDYDLALRTFDDRPPFVVRKVEKDLIERMPSGELERDYYWSRDNKWRRKSLSSLTPYVNDYYSRTNTYSPSSKYLPASKYLPPTSSSTYLSSNAYLQSNPSSRKHYYDDGLNDLAYSCCRYDDRDGYRNLRDDYKMSRGDYKPLRDDYNTISRDGYTTTTRTVSRNGYTTSDPVYEKKRYSNDYDRHSAIPGRNLSSLRDKYDMQYDDWYTSPKRTDLIQTRVDRTLDRKPSLERLDRLKTYHGYTTRPHYKQSYDSYLY